MLRLDIDSMSLRTQVFIIDEVSMISAEMFEALEEQAREVRQSQAPFGGIQLVLSGDYFQCASLRD